MKFFKILILATIPLLSFQTFAQNAENLDKKDYQFLEKPTINSDKSFSVTETEINKTETAHSLDEYLSQNCSNQEEITDQVLQQVRNKNPNAILILPKCFRSNRGLILKVASIDPSQLKNAAEILKEDENFVRLLLKIDPTTLQYASQKLLSNYRFMRGATYLSRDALQYADSKLLNEKLFMREMIKIDSRNYIFASDRLKLLPEFAKMAFEDDGLLLKYAPKEIISDRKLVKIAFKSNNSAIEYAEDSLKQEKDFKILKKPVSGIFSKKLEDFLRKNYFKKSARKDLAAEIFGKGKFFSKNKIIDRNYITKWRGEIDYDNIKTDENLRLTSANDHNYPIFWKEDFHKYPDLISKIEKFFIKHNVDRNTIDSLSTTYFWKIKDKPLTLAFNLYLLRDSSDYDLGAKFSDVTSLTAIAQKQKDKFEMSVVEVIFDKEIKTEITYENGHKKYVLWDLYKNDVNDKNPKIIFRVEAPFNDYFEVFEEQAGGKYKLLQKVETRPEVN